MGFEVWPVNTVHFSNHTGYGEWRGSVLPADDVAGIVRAIEDRGVLPRCGAGLGGDHGGGRAGRGAVLPADGGAGIVRGIEDRGVLPRCDAVLSGYMGDASLGEVIVGAVGRVKGLNAKAIYCCDPVMGDAGRGSLGRPGGPGFIGGGAG